MILNEANSSYFKTDTTGMDKYDHIINHLKYHEDTDNLTYRIRWMTPSNYIKRCARDIFNVDYERLLDNRQDKKIPKYVKMMKDGVKFDMPVINYSTHNQEGLHRCISAMKLNDEELVPVMIVYNKLPLDKFIPKKGINL